MAEVVDFFFSPYPSAQEVRLRAAIEDGLAHGSRIEPQNPLPNQPVTLLFSTNASLPIDHVAVYYTVDGTEPSGAKGVATHGTAIEAKRGETVQNAEKDYPIQQWRAILPAQPDGTLVRYRADGWSSSNPQRYWFADNVDPISIPPLCGRLFAYHVDRWTTPQWWCDAIVYHIFVDRFSAANDEPALLDSEKSEITGFFGGTLKGILEKMDYIQELGANCIWLSPIFESPTHHGYNASDYYTVAKRYGTNDTLRQLTREAHRRGMRVMLDFVANHTSHEHPFFVAALNNPTSPTEQWYAFGDWPPHGYHSYALVAEMPQLRTEHPEVQRYLFDAAQYWLGELGVDGFRLDYVPGPPHGFWTLFHKEVKEHFPETVMLGEITAPLEHIANYAGRIDAFIDFPLTQMLRRVFALRSVPLIDLFAFLNEQQPLLPPGMATATFLDNHDMHRFLWLAQGKTQRLKLAAACHMTLEGTPIIYYGTEVGLSQYNDAHKENAYARAPMLWDGRQDTSLLDLYRRLTALRHAHPALRYGKRTPLLIELTNADNIPQEQDQVGGYIRSVEQKCILVLLNNSEQPVQVRILVADSLKQAGTAQQPTTLRNLLTISERLVNHEIDVRNGIAEVELEGLDAVILELGEE